MELWIYIFIALLLCGVVESLSHEVVYMWSCGCVELWSGGGVELWCYGVVESLSCEVLDL